MMQSQITVYKDVIISMEKDLCKYQQYLKTIFNQLNINKNVHKDNEQNDNMKNTM